VTSKPPQAGHLIGFGPVELSLGNRALQTLQDRWLDDMVRSSFFEDVPSLRSAQANASLPTIATQLLFRDDLSVILLSLQIIVYKMERESQGW
jgi:hypothetical protein